MKQFQSKRSIYFMKSMTNEKLRTAQIFNEQILHYLTEMIFKCIYNLLKNLDKNNVQC